MSPDSPASDDWAEVLELWQNIAVQLPRADNIQVTFREVFPQKWGGAKWADHFAAAMSAVGAAHGHGHGLRGRRGHLLQRLSPDGHAQPECRLSGIAHHLQLLRRFLCRADGGNQRRVQLERALARLP